MKDFVIVHMLETYQLDKPFSIWGYHMTIMQWFEAPSSHDVISVVRPIINQTQKMELIIAETIPFGAKNNARVVGLTSSLQELHQNILSAVQNRKWKIYGRYTGNSFLPHITSRSGRLIDQDLFLLDKIQIAESLPQNYRRITAEISLN